MLWPIETLFSILAQLVGAIVLIILKLMAIMAGIGISILVVLLVISTAAVRYYVSRRMKRVDVVED